MTGDLPKGPGYCTVLWKNDWEHLMWCENNRTVIILHFWTVKSDILVMNCLEYCLNISQQTPQVYLSMDQGGLHVMSGSEHSSCVLWYWTCKFHFSPCAVILIVSWENKCVCKQYRDAFRKARFSTNDLNVKATSVCNL
jgi:hypothetical protein